MKYKVTENSSSAPIRGLPHESSVDIDFFPDRFEELGAGHLIVTYFASSSTLYISSCSSNEVPTSAKSSLHVNWYTI